MRDRKGSSPRGQSPAKRGCKKRKVKRKTYADIVLDDLGARRDESIEVDHVELAVVDDGLEVAALVLADVAVQRIDVLGRVERVDADAETVGFGAEA